MAIFNSYVKLPEGKKTNEDVTDTPTARYGGPMTGAMMMGSMWSWHVLQLQRLCPPRQM